MLSRHTHPNLFCPAFICRFDRSIDQIDTPDAVRSAMAKDFLSSFDRSDELRQDVRNLIRHNGYKPTGRGKPASEYLIKMGSEHGLRSINLPVDVCNAVSFHSGLPISVIDLDKAADPFEIKCAAPETSYIFNPSGQEINASGLLSLHDQEGPCANAVKDAQRTKTSETTQNTLTVIWGLESRSTHTEAALEWYLELLIPTSAQIEIL